MDSDSGESQSGINSKSDLICDSGIKSKSDSICDNGINSKTDSIQKLDMIL